MVRSPAGTTPGNISIWWPPDRNISCSGTSRAPYNGVKTADSITLIHCWKLTVQFEGLVYQILLHVCHWVHSLLRFLCILDTASDLFTLCLQYFLYCVCMLYVTWCRGPGETEASLDDKEPSSSPSALWHCWLGHQTCKMLSPKCYVCRNDTLWTLLSVSVKS